MRRNTAEYRLFRPTGYEAGLGLQPSPYRLVYANIAANTKRFGQGEYPARL